MIDSVSGGESTVGQALARALTPASRELVEAMGQRATVMWRAAGSAYLDRDRTVAERLRRLDDELGDHAVNAARRLETLPSDA